MAAAIFWMKTRAGWRETNSHEIAGPGGKQFTVVIRRFFVDPDEEADPNDLASMAGPLIDARPVTDEPGDGED